MSDDEVVEGHVVEDVLPESVTAAEMVIRDERETMPAPQSVLPSPREWEASMAVAREIAGTQFVPDSYRGRPDSVLAAILTGREMGIGPMQSLRQIHMIDGRPAFAADLMMAKMRQGGVVIIESSVSDERAYIKARRRDTGEETEVEWTAKDADKAGLLKKRNWQTYPQDMLWARAVGRLARKLGSDLLGGLVYSKEEMEDWDDGGYGGDSGYQASTARPFDPEVDLMEGAIPGSAEAPKQIASILNMLDPTVQWGNLMDQAAQQVWGAAAWREIGVDDMPDFWRRLSNATRIMEKDHPNDFPPIAEEKIKEAFGVAFSGAAVEVTYEKVETPNIPLPKDEDDVPFDPPGDVSID